jgi:hypothetical protein
MKPNRFRASPGRSRVSFPGILLVLAGLACMAVAAGVPAGKLAGNVGLTVASLAVTFPMGVVSVGSALRREAQLEAAARSLGLEPVDRRPGLWGILWAMQAGRLAVPRERLIMNGFYRNRPVAIAERSEAARSWHRRGLPAVTVAEIRWAPKDRPARANFRLLIQPAKGSRRQPFGLQCLPGSDPRFSPAFSVWTSHPGLALQVLDEKLRAWCLARPDLTVDLHGPNVALSDGTRWQPEEYRRRLDESLARTEALAKLLPEAIYAGPWAA